MILPLPGSLSLDGRNSFEPIVCEFELRSPTFSQLTCATTADHEFKDRLADFISRMSETKVHSLAEIINFNLERPELTLPPSSPNQKDLHATLESHFSLEEIAQARANLRELGGPGGLDKVFDDYAVDIIASPGDSSLCSLAAAAGYPMAVVPLGALKVS